MIRLLTRPRDERGAAALIVALVTSFVLIVIAVLAVDIGHTWAKRGSLQHQVDRAAKYAAEQLPVDSTTVGATPTNDQLRVAKAAAYYLACHPVSGQSTLTTMPACPEASAYLTDAGINTLARAMLANGAVNTSPSTGKITFPAVNEVAITTPAARVPFNFGGAVGADGTVQSKSATAAALSPGDVLPMGMSATCIANAVGTTPLGAGDYISKVLPINYLSTGAPNQTGGSIVTNPTAGLVDWTDLTSTYNNSAGTLRLDAITIRPSGQVDLTFYWRGNRNGWTVTSIRIYIRKEGYRVGDPAGLYETADLSTGLLGKTEDTTQVSFTLPPGRYQAMVRLRGTNGVQTQHWISNSPPEFLIPEPTMSVVSCARPVQSPRSDLTSSAGDSDAMAANFALGLDHGLAHFPGLANAVDNPLSDLVPSTTLPKNVGGLVAGVNTAFQCDTNSRVKKDYPTRRTDGANCFRVDTTQDWSTAVTKGLLTGGTAPSGTYAGRLRCPSTGPCNFKSGRPVLTNPGGIAGTYNNDRFEDFVKSGSLLDDPFFMSLDSFLSPSLPLVTPPNDVVDEALYDSPRFFWAPVSLSPFTTVAPGAAGDHPILTFRPVFLTADSSTNTLVSRIDMFLRDLVTAGKEQYGHKTTLQYFADSVLNLSPCDGVLSLLTLLTGLLTQNQLDACELELLKTPLFNSGSSTTTVGAFIEKYLGVDIVTKDSANTGSFGGLVIDKRSAKVRAARFMTIAPGALPAVPRHYDGPTSPYLGVGPKIIRLVK